MSIYRFNSDLSLIEQKAYENMPLGANEYPAVRQLDHNEPRHHDIPNYEDNPFYVEAKIIPGFRALDEAVKNYFSGIRVPTKDNYRFMRVKIAGGDKSILIWSDDLKEGRVQLPVAAVSRDSADWNADKFSPQYHPLGHRFVNSAGTKVAKFYRPVPYLVKYSMTIWSQSKRDAEFISYQILPRFNPLAEFVMYDSAISGSVQLRFDGMTDASDKETGFDQVANVRYDLSFTAEAWLPLPEKIVPTVLGNVATIREATGEIFQVDNGPIGTLWSESLNYNEG